jgi:hypothetical protein
MHLKKSLGSNPRLSNILGSVELVHTFNGAGNGNQNSMGWQNIGAEYQRKQSFTIFTGQ